jgi:hypothetical protein
MQNEIIGVEIEDVKRGRSKLKKCIEEENRSYFARVVGFTTILPSLQDHEAIL